MSAVVVLPDFPLRPVLSPTLAHALWLVGADQSPGDVAREEASAALVAAGPMLRPGNPARMHAWLMRINLGMAQPVPAREFEVRAPVLMDALNSYPAALFTAETAREIMLKTKWFPGAAELAEMLAPRLNQIREYEIGLRRVIEAPEPPPPRAEPTQAERAAVADIVASIGGGKGRFNAQAPERTIEEQLEALRKSE